MWNLGWIGRCKVLLGQFIRLALSREKIGFDRSIAIFKWKMSTLELYYKENNIVDIFIIIVSFELISSLEAYSSSEYPWVKILQYEKSHVRSPLALNTDTARSSVSHLNYEWACGLSVCNKCSDFRKSSYFFLL